MHRDHRSPKHGQRSGYTRLRWQFQPASFQIYVVQLLALEHPCDALNHVRDSGVNTIVIHKRDSIPRMKRTLAERLAYAREMRGLSQPDLAKLAHVSQGTIGNAEAGIRKKPRELNSIAKALRVRPEWLEKGAEPMEEKASKVDSYVFAVHAKGLKAIAGNGRASWDFEEIDQSHAFRADWVASKKLNLADCRILEVDGDSMAPYLNHGDAILVDMSDREVAHGKVYVISLAHRPLLVKRLFERVDGGLTIHSDSASDKYPDETVPPEHRHLVHIVGRVRWHCGEDD